MPQPPRPTSPRPPVTPSRHLAAPPKPAPPKPAPPKPAALRVRVNSDPANIGDVRKAVEAYAVAAGLTVRDAADVGLSVNEAMANVIRHAYGGAPEKPIVVSADRDDCGCVRVRVTIRDWGNGVNPAELPEQPYDPKTPGGLGLICLRELMDHVAYTPQPDGMLLTMTKGKC